MFNLSRQVKCPICHKLTAWKGYPEFTDRLHCQYCEAFIVVYEEYLRDMLRQDISQTMARYTIAGACHNPVLIKNVIRQNGLIKDRY